MDNDNNQLKHIPKISLMREFHFQMAPSDHKNENYIKAFYGVNNDYTGEYSLNTTTWD